MKKIPPILGMLVAFALIFLFVWAILKLTANTGLFQMAPALVGVVSLKCDRFDFKGLFYQLSHGDRILLKEWSEVNHNSADARSDPFLPDIMKPLFGKEHKVINNDFRDNLCVTISDYGMRSEEDPPEFYVHFSWVDEITYVSL